MATDIKIADLFPSRWLKAKDLTDAGLNRITDTVTRATLEDVQPQPGEHVERLALHLANHKPYLVTSKADATTLAEAYRVTTASQLVGRQIAIKVDVWRRQAVLRIAPPPPATAPAPKPNRPATTPAPVATSATGAPVTPPPAATAAPPVAPPAAANGAKAGAVELWPPREPWVARRRGTGEVDWSTSFWQLCAARQIERPAALAALAAAGGSMEDAARDMWEQRLGKDRDDEDADEEPVPAF